MVTYSWYPSPMVPEEMLEECASLYSAHYGFWSKSSPLQPGHPIRLSKKRIAAWLASPDANIVFARDAGNLVGYAIAIKTKVPGWGVLTWVSQLVVHFDYRRAGVAKKLLFSIWGFSNHYGWGLVTANPYAVRALEKATRRRCEPRAIHIRAKKLLRIGADHLPYISPDTETDVTSDSSKINTQFYLDHSKLAEMTCAATGPDKKWLLGDLREGWEWLAFTFASQDQFGLTTAEIESMLSASDDVTREAYSRMVLGSSHSWTRHTEDEVSFILRECRIAAGATVLDIGCGTGRHVHALASRGVRAVGTDYVSRLIEDAKRQSTPGAPGEIAFHVADGRFLDLGQQFNAVLCLYDVVGSFVDEESNLALLKTIARHLQPDGYALISVMNLVETLKRGPSEFSLENNPDRLLTLPSSSTMEQTGDVFNPDLILVDSETGIVYRKEQFSAGGDLPVELIVRDKRFTPDSIEYLCRRAGLAVVWQRFVRAGRWDDAADQERGKEILVLCRHSVAGEQLDLLR